MIDTPKARELGLPWTVERNNQWGFDVLAANGFRSVAADCVDVRPGDLLAAAESTNLVGPHLDDAERMAALRAVSAMDDMDFGMLADFLKERGFM